MFAGIVERVCTVAAVHPTRWGQDPAAPAATPAVCLEVDLADLAGDLEVGASVAINGVCLTLAGRRGAIGAFDVVPETWRTTNLSRLRPGDGVNVERSLRLGDRIDGHFVQGHVDGVGTVARVDQDAGGYQLHVQAPGGLMPFIVRKGSVALDGTSLTVVDVQDDRFSVALIPTTLTRTVLGRRRVGDPVNIETDIVARLVVARTDALVASGAARGGGGVTWERLQESGFLP